MAGDIAEPDQAHRRAGGLPPDEVVARPFAGDHAVGRAVGAAQQHQHGGDDIFGDRDGIGAARRADLDTARGTGVQVDALESDTEPADHLQLRALVQQRRIDPRAVAHDQRPGLRRLADKVVRPVDQVLAVKDVMRRRQFRRDRVVHEFRDDDIGHECPPVLFLQPAGSNDRPGARRS